jgi:outer membrane protein assembly factor BamB
MKPKFEGRSICLIIGFCILGSSARADDWPQWRGPQRNGSSKETGLLKTWPKEGPKLLWKVADVGSGHSTPAVVGEHLYLLTNEGMENEFVQSHSVKNGRRIWKTRVGNVGPNDPQANYAAARSTPTVDAEFLYALGSDGDLVAIQIDSGAVRWKKSLRKDFGGKPGDWAYAESPLIDGDTLVCTPGGEAATVLALNKKTGDVIWKCPLPEADQAAFASPILVETDGIRQYVQLLQKGLVGIDAKTGKFLWRYAKPVSRFGANIPTPIESGGYIYVGSAGTGGGSVRLKIKDGRPEPEELYFQSKLPTAIGGVVNVGGFLYGTTAQAMLCFELVTGKIKWEERALGAASICYVDGHFYLHGENGDVALVETSTESYREKGRFTPPDQPERTKPMEKAWAYPVVANGRLYIRDHGSLWCYDVEGKP